MIIHDDCLHAMSEMASNSISCVVTDPPYGLSFMGKGWDHATPGKEYWEECKRIMVPGAFLVAMGGTRTFHRLTCAIEDAGLEIRDCISWLYGSGLPKSHNHFGIEGYGTALKPAWEPCILAMKPCEGTFANNAGKWGQAGINIAASRIQTLTCQRLLDKISENEVLWEQEKCLCNSCVNLAENKTKLETLEIAESFATKSVGQILIENARQFLIDLNILDIGCSAIHDQEDQSEKVKENSYSSILKSGKNITDLNQKDLLSIILITIPMTIDLRICSLCQEEITHDITSRNILVARKEMLNMLKEHVKKEKGSRWPANLIMDDVAAKMLDEQSGESTSVSSKRGTLADMRNNKYASQDGKRIEGSDYIRGHADSGGASRFFYVAKASTSERNAGLKELPLRESKRHGNTGASPNAKPNGQGPILEQNHHPTVKPLKLMEYLIKLVMPPNGGTLLDPFAGSGTTLVAAHRLGINYIGIEKEKEYCDIAQARINFEKINAEKNKNSQNFPS